ncbi:MAG: flagellar assembly peptidoglycan hydrolase FlgJ [Immundisolibacteraceae bacterium]|nr:flagellar assembly peptidoglycan hydrolase FlgJ [Immundisolibacteraceae bacterium]
MAGPVINAIGNNSQQAATVGPRNLFDRQGMADLRRLSRDQNAEGIAAVAKQFESLFMGMMLDSMRQASLGENPLFGSSAEKTYQKMFDQQLAMQSAQRGGLGIAEMLQQQLLGRAPSQVNGQDLQFNNNPGSAAAIPALPGFDLPVSRGSVSSVLAQPSTVSVINSRAIQSQPSGLTQMDSLRASGSQVNAADQPLAPDQFLKHIWPLAVDAGERLGVAPDAIAAQALLESGWGQKTIHHADGQSSFNLFGIKAGPEWTGRSVSVSTLEFKQGIAVREQADFRAYDSFQQGFDDYVSFLQNRPWYQQALAVGQNSDQFAHELQKAGYATDPKYADKMSQLATQVRDALSNSTAVNEVSTMQHRHHPRTDILQSPMVPADNGLEARFGGINLNTTPGAA